jgi:hypothetical protein
MIGNGAKATTTTAGTGTVTLTAVTGYPQFSDVFNVGDFVGYFLQDGSNWEWGYGTLTTATTLARTYVESIFNAGVLTRVPTAGLTLSGGAVNVGVSVIESDKSSGIKPGLTADVYHQLISGSGSGAYAASANQLVLTPMCVPHTKYSGMKINVTTAAAAGGLAVAGIYRMGQTLAPLSGYPGNNLIAQTGVIDTTTTGIKAGSFSTPIFLGGWIFVAVNANLAVSLSVAASTNYGGMAEVQPGNVGTSNYYPIQSTGYTYTGTLPATVPAGSWNGSGAALCFSLTKS